ncbi:toxin Cn11-like [Centruroides sculpturatus]|uniref:toxin Cn11-like n=1 Tax=Centruroides sculpturatus TaxID=218467 RepID=UPI000C6EB915|nr:toxin Cn11-like [Centruroides sculpturatus]
MRNLILMVFSVAVAIREMKCSRTGYPIRENGCRISCVAGIEDDLCDTYCKNNGAEKGVCKDPASSCYCENGPLHMATWNADYANCEAWKENSVRFYVNEN